MKKIALLSIVILILCTSIVKNSTKEIEDNIFSIKENIKSLKTDLGDIKLEYDYLSSPEKLTEYKSQYFLDDLIRIDIIKIKKISTNNNDLQIMNILQINE
jgi:hypothetical protein